MLTYIPIRVEGRRGALELSESFSRLSDYARTSLVGTLILLCALFLGGGLLVVLLGVKWVGQPLNSLVEKTRRVDAGDLTGPLCLRGRDELSELARALNAMCDQLAKSQEQVHIETAARIATLEQLRHADRLKTVGRLACDKELPADVRVIATTNRDLESAVEEGRFRKDLYFRLNVIELKLAPLRARGTDVLLLSQHFVEQFAARSGKEVKGMAMAVTEKLLNYTWPGNVRELRNAIERAVALTRYETLVVEDLPEGVRDYRTSHVLIKSEDPTELIPMEEVERRYILHVLEAVGGNRTVAAQKLGFDRKTLYRKLLRYGAVDDVKE